MIRSNSAEPQIGDNSGTPAAQKLRYFLERIERLEEERKAIADDIAEVYKELSSEGYDKDAAKVVLKIRRNAEGLAAWNERSAIVDLYLSALGMLPEGRAPAPAHARVENVHEFPLRRADGGADIVTKQSGIAVPNDPITRKIQESAAVPHRRGSASTENVSDEISGLNAREALDSDEPSPEAGPQAEASQGQGTGAGTLADREGRHEGEAASVDLPTISPVGAADVHSVVAEAGAAVASVAPAEIAPAAPLSAGADGHPSIPSPDAGGSERAADEAGTCSAESGQAVEDFQPPVLLTKPRSPLRPHCQRPESCAGYGAKHCYACLKAAEQVA